MVDSVNNHTIIDTISKNQIYGVAGNIFFEYGGFLDKSKYEITFYVETQHGMSVTKTLNIDVEYDAIDVAIGDVIVTSLHNEAGNLIEFSGIKSAVGNSIGNISYANNYPVSGDTSVRVDKNSLIKWQSGDNSNLIIPDNSNILLSFQHARSDNATDYKILTLSGYSNGEIVESVLSLNSSGVLQYDVNEETFVGANSYYTDNYWNFVLIKPSDGKIYNFTYECNSQDSLLPSESLTPSGSLFPKMGQWGNSPAFIEEIGIEACANVKYDTLKIGDLNNNHIFYYDFCYITNDSINVEDLKKGIILDSNEAIFTENYDFCAKFENDLNAGNTLLDSLTNMELRRRKGANSYSEYVTMVDLTSQSFVVDYMIDNKNTYDYYLYPQNTDKIMNPVTINNVKTKWNYNCLMVVDDSDEDGVYYLSKMFVFGLNTKNGTMTNNTDITVTKNFTPYPFIQASPSNYWSSSLSGLIGFISCQDKEYYETPLMAEELKGLTTDTRKKFLKTVDGKVFQVQISSALNIEPSEFGSYSSATINWAEVGSTENISVINNPDMSINTWLLTNNGIVSPYLNYTWKDDYIWDDAKFWTGNNDVLGIK